MVKTAQGRGSDLPKSRTGIIGLDDVTGGGLPSGRPTLVCGSAGCGKTMLAMEFLVRGATQLPLRRFIGDMSQTERILLGLDLRATAEKTPPPTPNR